MSYLSDASLVMIPSGVEAGTVFTSKPAGGSADLTFTRSNDTATRVGPNGYIEKVRTNLLTYSNDTSNVAWTRFGATPTSGQSGYDGSSDAWLLSATGAGLHYALQSKTDTGILTFSIYAKQGTSKGIRIAIYGGVDNWANFNLELGTQIGTAASVIDTEIVSVGSGWYRISVTANKTTSGGWGAIYVLDNSFNISFTAAGETIYIQDAQLEVGDVATDYIETTTAAVSVGPVANVPRINFDPVLPRTGSLLLEPQCTAYNTNSENAAGWNVVACSVTSNATTAPDGYNGADLLTYISNGSAIRQDVILADTKATFSVFVKGNSGNGCTLLIRNVNTSTNIAENYFDGNTFTPQSGSYSVTSTSFGNGWYRVSITATSGITSGDIIRGYVYTDSGAGIISGSSIYVWGMNLTNTNYLQSYIPTYGAAATRGNEDCEKANINSLIGGTSGTIFFEIHTNKNMSTAVYKQLFYYTNASLQQMYAYINNGNVLVTNPNVGSMTSSITLVSDTTYKIALAYAPSDFKMYINGAEVGSSTSGTPLDAVNILSIGSFAGVSEWNEFGFNQFLHFQTRLTNDQLSQITTL